jgi:hypothetical protein
MKCVGLHEKVQGECKIGEVRQIHPKDTASLNGTGFNPARKENPFVSR